MSQLPPNDPDSATIQSRAATKHSMAVSIQTCSVADRQHDSFRLTRHIPKSYQISLTVDPTPLYRVEMPQSKDPLSQMPLSEKSQSQEPHREKSPSEKPQNEKTPNMSAFDTILVFDALDSKNPIATCCIATKSANFPTLSAGTPVAMICTRPEAQYQLSAVTTSNSWIPMYKMGFFSLSHYTFQLPVVMVPGCRPFMRFFGWVCQPWGDCLELRMRDVRIEGICPLEFVYAKWWYEKGGVFEKGVVDIRRGGGLEFELGVVVSALAIIEMRGL